MNRILPFAISCPKFYKTHFAMRGSCFVLLGGAFYLVQEPSVGFPIVSVFTLLFDLAFFFFFPYGFFFFLGETPNDYRPDLCPFLSPPIFLFSLGL